MSDDEPVFLLLAKLAAKLGATPLKGKMWTHQVDEHWLIALNGDSKPKETGPIGQSNCSQMLQPFECYVEFNGWPAGIFTPYGGTFAAGSLANEESFRAALEQAVKP